jgi:hypothetical protein
MTIRYPGLAINLKKQKKECSKQSSVTKGTREGGLKLFPIFMVQVPSEK